MSVKSNGKTILLIDVFKTFRVLFGPLLILLYKFLSDSLELFEAELLVCVLAELDDDEDADELDEFDDEDESDEEVLVVDDVDEENSFSSNLLLVGLGMNAFIIAELVFDELVSAESLSIFIFMFVFLTNSLSKLFRIVSERIIFFLSLINCLNFLKSSFCICLKFNESTCSILVERLLSSLLLS